MSKQSYINGFCKAAAQRNVDPRALARFASVKQAQAGGIWEGVKNVINQIKDRWDNVDPELKPLVGGLAGAGAGGLGGALAGKLFGFGAGRGALAGAGLGGLGGSLYGAHYGGKQTKARNLAALKAMADEYDKQRDYMQAGHDAALMAKDRVLADTKAKANADMKALQEKSKKDLEDAVSKIKAERDDAIRQSDEDRARIQGEMGDMESRYTSRIRDLTSENTALRLAGDVLSGMTVDDFRRLSPEEKKATMDRLDDISKHIGNAKANMVRQKFLAAIAGGVADQGVNQGATDAYKQRQGQRYEESKRKVMRDIDREVERQTAEDEKQRELNKKRQELLRNAKPFDYTWPPVK